MAAGKKETALFSPKSAVILLSYDYDVPLHYPIPQKCFYEPERRAHQEIRSLSPL